MESLCIFCGSASGTDAAHVRAASVLGRTLADRRITLVYGGGSRGLMGTAADAAIHAGGRVVGVIPEHLATAEAAHLDLPDLRIVDTMHQRKAMMAGLADAFIAMPGGFGTLEELFEVLTWAQIQLHAKPVGLLNTSGFYTPLLAFLDHAVVAGFLRPEARRLIVVDDQPARLLDRLAAQRTEAVDAAPRATEPVRRPATTPLAVAG